MRLLMLLGAALAVLFANDCWFKGAGLLPASVTGKLSDFAFLLFFPALVIWLSRARSAGARLAGVLVVALPFIIINLFPVGARALEAAVNHGGYRIRIWNDPTDLMALVMLPLAWMVGVRLQVMTASRVRFIKPAAALLALIALVNTSRSDSHTPVYMDKATFRKYSFAIRPPQPIARRGKILTYGRYLLHCEPNAGIHIIERRADGTLDQKSFIYILGCTDAVVKDDYLLANNLVDLLVFRIQEDGAVRYVRRMEDVFRYDPYASLPEDAFTRRRSLETDGKLTDQLVVGWK